MTITAAPVRRLDTSELSECLDLAVDRDWPREERKWRLLFGIGEVYGIDDPAGGLAACAVLTKFGDELAVISMVLVASRLGRQGLGRRVMRHVIEQSGNRIVSLYATKYGKPLYGSLGFAEAGAVLIHRGLLVAETGAVTRAATEDDLPALRRLDAVVSGADRTMLLDRLLADAEHVRVVKTGGVIAGYTAGSRFDGITVIGPVIAADEHVARALIAEIAVVAGGPVRVDLDIRHPGLCGWAQAGGLTAGDPSPFMVYGCRPMPGDGSRRYAPVLQALG